MMANGGILVTNSPQASIYSKLPEDMAESYRTMLGCSRIFAASRLLTAVRNVPENNYSELRKPDAMYRWFYRALKAKTNSCR
jgi:hypothetical protein